MRKKKRHPHNLGVQVLIAHARTVCVAGRYSVERNQSSVELGKKDPEWQRHQKHIKQNAKKNIQGQIDQLTLGGHQKLKPAMK